MFDFMNITKALTDENRVRILMALRGRSLCVCQVTAFLDLAPSTTSKHLSVLRQARLIEGRKRGKWVYYSLADTPESLPLARSAIRWLMDSLRHSTPIIEDEKRIELILAREEKICGDPELDLASWHSMEIHALAESEEE